MENRRYGFICAKYDYYANYPRVFCRGCICSLYSTRARCPCESALVALQRMETKGFPASSTTQRTLAFVYKRSFISGT